MRRVVDRVALEITKNWTPVSKFNANVSRFESNPEFVQIVPSSEPVVVVSMEIKIHGNSTLMNICYPYMFIYNCLMKFTINNPVCTMNTIGMAVRLKRAILTSRGVWNERYLRS